MFSLLVFLIVLGAIVFVHELGHFLAAKRAGMRVEEFGLGFPPRMFGIKRGDTVYSVNWIPLGGFVKIKGEGGEDAWDADSFASQSKPKRLMVVLAGVAMNVVLAFACFTAGFLIGVPQAVDPSAPAADRAVRVAQVVEGTPAALAGLELGDQVAEIDGTPVASSDALRSAIKDSAGPIALTVRRGSETKQLTVTPEILPQTGSRGIGVQLVDLATVRYPWYSAPFYAAQATVSMLGAIVASFARLIAGIFVGHGVMADLSGPVGIAVATGQATRLGFAYLMEFAALLSLNLAVINAVPFPALDGGRFLFLILEAIRRRPVSRRVEAAFHQVGFVLLMFLVLAVTYRDLLRYGGAIGGFFRGLF